MSLPLLFASPSLQVRELARGEVPALQALFDANPSFFQRINGRPARPDEAQCEFDEAPPAHLSYAQRWVGGVHLPDGPLVGVIHLLSDFCTPGAWHIALFWLVDRLHGQGLAAPLHQALQDHVQRQGALWLRLSVIVGNTPAERFWQRQGYQEVRRRLGLDTGGRLNDARVMVKPLAGLDLNTYLQRVPRDRPDADLP